MAERQHASRALLDTGRTTHAFGVPHRQAFVREIHDVDSLVANRGADVARNAFRYFGKNPEAREARVDMHQRRERAKKPTPDPAGILEIEPDADDTAEKNVDQPFVIRVGDELTVAVFPLEQ